VLINVATPEFEPDGADGAGEGEMGFSVPGSGIGRSVVIEQIAGT
jgi:hypothetical protein